MPDRAVRCRRCGSSDLVLREAIRTVAEYAEGLYVNDEGQIVARGVANFLQGDPMTALMRIECLDCGHDWSPRRWFIGAEIPDA